MQVDEFSEFLNSGDDAGEGNGTTEHRTVDFDRGLPGGAGEFAEQTAFLATVQVWPALLLFLVPRGGRPSWFDLGFA